MNNNQENRVIYRVSSLLFVALVILIIYFDISSKYFQQGIQLFSVDSPLLFPFLVFLVLLLGFIFEFKSEIKKILKQFAHSGKQETKNITQTKELWDIIVFTVISVIYIYLLPRLHFIIATSLYMFCNMLVVNESDKVGNKCVKSLLATAVTIPIIYYIFYGIFDVILP